MITLCLLNGQAYLKEKMEKKNMVNARTVWGQSSSFVTSNIDLDVDDDDDVNDGNNRSSIPSDFVTSSHFALPPFVSTLPSSAFSSLLLFLLFLLILLFFIKQH
jgi:hypothetical protein